MAFRPHCSSLHRDYIGRWQLKTVYDSLSSQPVIDYTYLPDGKVDHADYRNGVRCTYGYDGRGMIKSVDHSRAGSQQDLSRREYTRDSRDRIISFKKGTSGYNPMEDGRGDRFRYDDEGQLMEAWYNAVDPANSGAGNNRYDGFSYDELGNRESRVGSNFVASHGPMTFTRKDNGLNQYSGWSPYNWIKYDDDIGGTWGAPHAANGVQMQDGNTTAGFNSLNQPMMILGPGMSDWEYFGYDPLGRCVKRWVGGNPATYLYYEGWNLIQEGPSSNSASRNYIHGARVDEVVKEIKPANWEERYFHYDARGHCTLQTDASGNIVEQYEYDAFGYPYFFDGSGNPLGSYDAHGIWRGYSPWGNRFLFTGREYLSELALYDYRNRMYQPELGRFMQPDPKEFAAGDYNLYRYCHNDPINKADPTGLDTVGNPITVELEKIRRMTLGSNIPHFITVVKIAFTALANAAMSDHTDRAQTLFQDGGKSRIGTAYYVSHLKGGTFIKDEKHEDIPVGDGSRKVALFLHFHDDVRPGDSSTYPSIPGPDAKAVIGAQAPMIYSATSLYRAQQGVLITPNGQRDPVQTPVYFNW